MLTAPVPNTKKHPYTVPPAPVMVYVIPVAVEEVTLEGEVPVEDADANTAVPRTGEPPQYS